jgi:hypothetical protein
MERYTAFTHTGSRARFFRVWHQPWRQVPVEITIAEQSLLECNWPLFRNTRPVGANFSPGLNGVWMGRPHTWPKARDGVAVKGRRLCRKV